MTTTTEITEDWHEFFLPVCRRYVVVQFSHGREQETSSSQRLGDGLLWAISMTSDGQSEVLGHWKYMGLPISALPEALAALYSRGLEHIGLLLVSKATEAAHGWGAPGPTVRTWHESDKALASDKVLTARQRRAANASRDISSRVDAAMHRDGRIHRRFIDGSVSQMTALASFLARAMQDSARTPGRVARLKSHQTRSPDLLST